MHSAIAQCVAAACLGHLAMATSGGMCGIATNMLDSNNDAMTTFCDSKLGFWWNWFYAPRREYSAACAQSTFVPMIWGNAPANADLAKTYASKFGAIMGYNEPDHWGPPQYPGGQYLSAGSFVPNFHCSDPGLAANWQQTVMAYLEAKPYGMIISPSLADANDKGSAGQFASCNTAQQMPASHQDDCDGWLKCFKESVTKLQCGERNCWDVIDVLQFHAYYYDAADLINKVKIWEQAWVEDLNGLNGRTKKTLWLTEFARAGTTDSNDPDGKCREFMEESIAYLKASPYVSAWSWFSQTNETFGSFPIYGVTPKDHFWASDLIDASGKLTVIGEKYVSLCSDAPPVVPGKVGRHFSSLQISHNVMLLSSMLLITVVLAAIVCRRQSRSLGREPLLDVEERRAASSRV